MRNINAHTQYTGHIYTHAKAVSVSPAANKTAEYKELQMCRDGHEDFRSVGHQGEVHTNLVILRGHSCRKSEGVKPV